MLLKEANYIKQYKNKSFFFLREKTNLYIYNLYIFNVFTKIKS